MDDHKTSLLKQNQSPPENRAKSREFKTSSSSSESNQTMISSVTALIPSELSKERLNEGNPLQKGRTIK